MADNVEMSLLPEGCLYKCDVCSETMFYGNEVMRYLDYMDKLVLVDKDIESFRKRHEHDTEFPVIEE